LWFTRVAVVEFGMSETNDRNHFATGGAATHITAAKVVKQKIARKLNWIRAVGIGESPPLRS
jgi:hypothetical protein